MTTSHARARLAAAHLQRASQAREAGDDTASVLWLSYAAEAAITVLADAHGLDTQKSHQRRTTVARRLHDLGVLPDDVAALLIRLNTERTAAVHDGRAPDLRGRTADEVHAAVAKLVETAAA